MTLSEDLCRKYALTSFRARGGPLAVLAINEALEAAAEVAEQEQATTIATRIRSLKWSDRTITVVQQPAGSAHDRLSTP